MYHNVPKKMQRNKFKLASCPKPKQLFASAVGLQIPSYPTGQTAVVDVDPVEAINRASLAEYSEYVASEEGRKAAHEIYSDEPRQQQ